MYIKKITCMFLAFMIAVTFMPAYGFAAGDDPANPDDYVITDGSETDGSNETTDGDNQGTEGTLHFEKESDTFDMSEHLEGDEDYYYDYAYYTLKVINGSNMSYVSSNTEVAFIESSNDESAILYVRGAGETDITAYSGDGQSAVFKLSVTSSVKQLSIYTDGSYGVGDSFDMRYEVIPSCLHDSADIEWSSSDSNLASVDGKGRVTLKKCGDVTITAKCGDITASREINWSNNTFSNDEFEYSVAGKREATITKYKGSNTEIVIPSEIDGYTVTAVGEKEYYYESFIPATVKVKKVILPETLKQINDNAFRDLSTLEEINIPDSVTYIGTCAFSGCENLKSVHLPAGLKSLGEYAFQDNNRITEVTIPDGVQTIGEFAFLDCDRLQTITYNTDADVPLGMAESCGYLSKVTFNGHPKKISEGAFAYCTKLKEVTLSDGLEEIDESAFCSRGWEENPVEMNIKLPDSLKRVGDNAFSNCFIETLNIPKNVEYMGPTSGIGSFTVDSENANYSAKDGVLFNKDQTVLIAYPSRNERRHYEVPSGVKEIGPNAMSDIAYEYYGKGLKQVVFPETLKTIGDNALDEELEYIFPKSLESIGAENMNEHYNNQNQLYYRGTEEDWKSIDIDVYRNDYLCNVNNIVCNYKTTGLRLSSSIVNIHKDYDGYYMNKYVRLYTQPDGKEVKQEINTANNSVANISYSDEKGMYSVYGYMPGTTVIMINYGGYSVPLTVTVDNNIDPETPRPYVAPASNAAPSEVVDLPAIKISKPKAAKKAATVKWKKVSKKNKKKISRIEIQYSQAQNFSYYSTKTVKVSKRSLKIKKLSKGTTYYIRIRGYKYINGIKHVSHWSAVKKVKAK